MTLKERKERTKRNRGGKELPSIWYDKAYTDSINSGGAYSKPPEDNIYSKLWTCALEWVSPQDRILDLGCGTGQFERLAVKNGRTIARAIDFSQIAVGYAQKTNPTISTLFCVGDLRSIDMYKFTAYDIIVSFEVFEHIQDDLFILKNIPKDKPIIFSVPSFEYISHVRCFKKYGDIVNRYGKFINIIKFHKIMMNIANNKYIWLIYGVMK